MSGFNNGNIVTVALDEDRLAEYAELFDEVQSLDGLLERIVASSTIPAAVLEACEVSAYITSTSKYYCFHVCINNLITIFFT